MKQQYIVITTEGGNRSFAYLVEASSEEEAVNEIATPTNTVNAVARSIRSAGSVHSYGRLKAVQVIQPAVRHKVDGYWGAE
jgi:hypothetical protein